MLQFIFLSLLLYCSQYAASTPVSTFVYSQVEDIWLRLHIVPATWTVAAVKCQLEGGVLATPTTSALAETMRAAMAENKLSSVYIGVTESFSKGDYKSLDGTAVADIPLEWAAGEPNNANKSEHCLALTGAGALADVSCSSGLPYFCRKVLTQGANSTTVVPPCSGKKGYLWEPRTGSCYKFHGVAETWLLAFRTCHVEGGHLAIINSNTESTVLKEIHNKNSKDISGAKYPNYTHIGFTKWNDNKWVTALDSESTELKEIHNKNSKEISGANDPILYTGSTKWNDNKWVTVHGETLAEAGFGNWSPGEPNNHGGEEENCGSIFNNGLLNDIKCDDKYPYICEFTP